MEFKVGDIIKGKNNSYAFTNVYMYEGQVTEVFGQDIKIKILDHKKHDLIGKEFVCCNVKDGEFEIIRYLKGIRLLQEIEKGNIKNCDIKVYKKNKYQFTIQCGEKAILDNPNHHIGMLTSDKYTYEPIIKKEMTVSEIEKELGYSIKIVKG